MTIDHGTFFARYKEAYGRLSNGQFAGLKSLLQKFEDTDQFTRQQVAYMLATVKHECDDCWKPIREYGTADYFLKYEPHTNLGQRLGNTEPGDGERYCGRGYVQITGRDNYRRLSAPAGVDLETFPELALGPHVAFRIMSRGMRDGLFTGRGLDDFINTQMCDYLHARRIINGMDRAERIADYARRLEHALELS